MRILMIGDVVGSLGRRTVRALLPALRRELTLDLVIANGENAAGGRGLTNATAQELFNAGVDILTSGNHVWEHREAYDLLDGEAPILRPLNYPPAVPGHGFLVYRGVGVLNVMGRTFTGLTLDCPFRAADDALPSLKAETAVVIVDMHAEATSEKAGMGWYLDGRAGAVLGTHTHVATADGRILPQGTAYITDVGMVGPRDSIIGMEVSPILERFLTQLPTRFSPVERGAAIFNAVLVEVDEESGRALAIQRIDRELP
ncbi:MAG: TIGR00282 family metallophosphoesterase [Dehalococcoidia bacterium]